MGMFDSDLGKIWGEHFKEDAAFTLEDAKMGPVIPTDFGQTQVVLLKIDGERYSIMGTGIVNQVKAMQPGDLPAEVKIIRKPTKVKGQSVKLIVPANYDGNPDDIPF